jgi:hypothetical protein
MPWLYHEKQDMPAGSFLGVTMKIVSYGLFVLICGIPFLVAAAFAFAAAKWMDICCRPLVFKDAREWWLGLILP